ncbi:MAG TPA: family 78 glycoside hydrolase catalytic domain [Terriglobales bacterium]|nr:family 78 glycoside hydrolase catalytic domain [Terriglobales bacterium]
MVAAAVAVILLPISGLSQATAPKSWTAQWITAPDIPQRDEAVLHFRKVLDLADAPAHFVVHVSADNQFIFFVNGQHIGSGPARSDLAHWRYETYDIGSHLHAGRNVIAATVWNFATNAAVAQMSDRTAFLVQSDEDAERAADTNVTWEVEQEKAITTVHPQVHGYYAAEPDLRFDGAQFDWSWNTESNGPKSAWTKAKVLSRAAPRLSSDSPNSWQLVPDPLPRFDLSLVSSGKVVRATGIPAAAAFPEGEVAIPAHTAATILLDAGQLTTAYPQLTVAGGRGSTIHLTYAEALIDDKGEKGNRNQIEGKHIEGVADDFLPDGSESCNFIPLVWRTWRYLQLDVQTSDQPMRLLSLKTWFTAFPFEERAYFHSDNPSLAPIWQIGWRTARLDAHDTYMDTPYWERLQYVGDTRIQALISYTVAGDDRLARQAIDAYNNSRIPDGLTQSRYPSSLVQMIPTFSLLWVGMVHDFWMYRGDADFVRVQLPGTRTVLDWYLRHQRADGLLAKLPWWPFVDWGKDFRGGVPSQDEDGGSSVITLQFIEALRYATELESAYGDAHLAQLYRAAADRAAEAVFKSCWNSQYGILADTLAQTHFSQHANILGVWLDVIPYDQQKEVMQKLLSASDSGFATPGPLPQMTSATYYFRFYLARALEHSGMADDYLRLLDPWHQMVALGLTTWAESPEPTRSDSHAWSAHPNYDLLTIVAGIHPKAAGFSTVRIEPHLGALQHVEAAVPTPHGMVEVKYDKSGVNFQAQVTLPSGTSGDLVWKGRIVRLHAGEQKVLLP